MRGYDWARVVTAVEQDRVGRLAVATVRLGLAVLSSGITLLPWPTPARLDALFVAAREPQELREVGSDGGLLGERFPLAPTSLTGHPLSIGATR